MLNHHGTNGERLSEWYKIRLARPILVVFTLMIVLQLLLLVYQQREKNAELAGSIESLSKIFSLAISQKNRPMIEMSAAFAMQNSGLKTICIFEDGSLQYMIPFDLERHCDLRPTYLFKVIDVVPSSLPNYRFKILTPRYPEAIHNLLLLLVGTLLVLPIFLIILNIRKAIEIDVIRPLLDSINNLTFDGLSKILQNPPFRISELNDLIKAHHEKLVAIGEHISREAELEKEAGIGRVISQLSHDLRAPLGNIERLLYLPEGSTVHSEKAVISESIHRMNSMIEALRRSDLDLIIDRKRVEFDLNTPWAGLNHRALSKAIRLKFRNVVASKLWLDSEKFERAWVNLVSNAVDFARSEVWFDISPQGKDLVVRVVDDGPGVPGDFLPKLFQRGATHGKADGTGLGLAYVRQIMRGHGGDVTYRRENGLTVFECVLPNAVESEKDHPVEKSATLEIQLHQKIVRKVAICLEPRKLSESVLAKLSSLNSDEFVFIEERREANIVVSNVESIMFEVMESDEQEHISVAQFKGDEDWMIEVLKLKFNLAGEVSGA